MMTLWQDLRYALHSFRTGRSGMVLSAIVLALAIGAATTTYSVVSAVVLRSLPFEDPDALVGLRLGRIGPDGLATSGGTLSRQSVEGDRCHGIELMGDWNLHALNGDRMMISQLDPYPTVRIVDWSWITSKMVRAPCRA